MACGHAACIFASTLNGADCARMCALCHVKHYARGQNFEANAWENFIVLTLEGIMIDLKPINEDRRITVGIRTPGSLSGLEGLFPDADPEIMEPGTVGCLTECRAALFPAAELREMIRLHPAVLHPILRSSVLRQMKDRTDMLLYLGFGDARTSVSYVLNYLRAHDLENLTHEQIALICNRSRQTVTAALNALQRESNAEDH